MKKLLSEKTFDYISSENKDFIVAFDEEMQKLGYISARPVGDGYCWGKNMVIYTKAGVKSKKSYARIYMRDDGLVLRLYFSGVEKHSDFIEQAPDFVQAAFTGDFAACEHCHGKTDCAHQKRYSLHGRVYEVCDGKAFWFCSPATADIPAYLALFSEFYPAKKGRENLK